MPSAVRVSAWSNGGFSADPSHPDYGTHDWIAHHALDWLPTSEKSYIVANLASYLYGSELPDNGQASDGIGDTGLHHVYYSSSGALKDDAAAVRASTVFGEVVNYLRFRDSVKAAKYAGIMSHYIVDLAVFGHVMGSDTDWGAEKHHSDYETYVNQRTSSYDAEFNVFLSFDGNLTVISAYNATIYLAYDTTFDLDGDLTCLWMDQNYDWSNPAFKNRCGESLNLAVNLLADVLHTLYVETTAPTPDHVVINEFEQNPQGEDAGNEWVELYNPTANSIDVGGWTLSTTSGVTVTVTIPPATKIPAYGYYIVTYGAQWLDNELESVILRDKGGNEVDRTPALTDTFNDGRSWQRYPNGQDTDSISDWSFRASTKGGSNGGEVDTTPPNSTDNYDGLWHNADFTITLTATDDASGVAETYYKINNGSTKAVSADGQPRITTEGANNTLEYLSVDRAGKEEFPHKILTGIKLDKTAPTGSIMINNNATYATTTSVTLTLTATDATSGVYQVRFSNDGVWDTEPWENPSPTRTWALTLGDGTKRAYYQIRDKAGLISITYSDTIILETTPPTGSITVAGGATYTNSSSVTLTLSAEDNTSGVAQMRFSNNNVTWTPWEAYSTSKAWTLITGDGTKTVYVQFRDKAGLTSPTYQDTIVLDTTKPVANAGQDKKLNVGETVVFDAGASTDNVSIVSYEWEFGDGTRGTGRTTTHTYAKAGTYTVTLTVKDAAGNTANHSITVTVAEAFPTWIAGAVIAAIAVIIGAVFAMRKRKPKA